MPQQPANGARILSVNAVPTTQPVDLIHAEHPADNAMWGVARFVIRNLSTIGSPSCAGCSTPACIVFASCNISTVVNLANHLLTGANTPGSDYVTWQGGRGTNCPAATPTRNATWGKVKSLHR